MTDQGEACPTSDAGEGLHRPALFQQGLFDLHSGGQTTWKINCDALADEDLATVACLLSGQIGRYGSVEGVPSGGLRLAEAFRMYQTDGPLLIVDDVLTTGASMEEQRAGRDAIGAVIFARGKCPPWVTPLFVVGEELVSMVAALVGALEAQQEADTYFTAERIEELDKLDSIEREVKAHGEWEALREKAKKLRDAALANLPEAARRAQAHDEMAAELEALRVEVEEHRQHAQDKTAEVERLRVENDRITNLL